MLRILIFFLSFFSWQVLLSQNPALAKSYFEKGELDKAAYEYKLLYEKFPYNDSYLLNLIKIYQSQGKYSAVEKLLQNLPLRQKPYLWVYLGYNYHLQKNETKAAKYYQKALKAVTKQSMQAYMVGEAFKQVYLLDEALKTYQIALKQHKNPALYLKMALIYAEKNNMPLMIRHLLLPLQDEAKYMSQIKYYLARYITDNPENEINIILKKQLIQHIQQTHAARYYRLLQWLYTEQKEYKKAFFQLKSLYKKKLAGLGEIFHLAQTAVYNKKNADAKFIYHYIITQPEAGFFGERAKLALLDLDLKQILNKEDQDKISLLFKQYLQEPWSAANKFDLQLSYADFLAFHLKQTAKALELLKQVETLSLTKRQKAAIKLKQADISLYQKHFNQALVLYTQVQLDFPNHPTGHRAIYDIARTSFFKGDINWAHAQLKIIKSVADDLIANDAIDLDLTIINNKEEGDSLQTGLKTFARAKFEVFRKNPDRALRILDTLTRNFKGQLIYDDALILKGKILTQQKKYKLAIATYQAVLDNQTEDLLKDDALYKMALIEEKLGNLDTAKILYKKIILNYPASFWLTDAQKHYRKLRGDVLP